MFNALRYSRELEAAGFTRQQAEATINAFFQFMEHSFASKDDFMVLKGDIAALKGDLLAQRSELKGDIEKLATLMEHKFVVQRKSLLLHLYLLQGASAAFVVGTFFGIVKLFL